MILNLFSSVTTSEKRKKEENLRSEAVNIAGIGYPY